MTDVRAVIFDAGNTLVFVDAARMTSLMHGLGVQVDVAAVRESERRARLHLTEHLHQGATGTEAVVWREYFLNIFRFSGLPEGLEEEAGVRLRALHEADHIWTEVADDTRATLARIASMGYRMAVVSNADGRVERLLRARGLGDHFEFVIDSHVFGAEKPHPSIFRAATDRLGIPPGECLYVGDLYPIDVVGARSAGLQAVLLDPWDHFQVDVDRIPTVADLPEYLRRRGGS